MEEEKKTKFVFIGAGWVGSLTSAVLASHWPENEFHVFDISTSIIDRWNSGQVPIYEPGLEELVKKSIGKNLFFTANKDIAFKNATVFFICVNTPTKVKGKGKGEVHDLKFVEACTSAVADYFANVEMKDTIAIVEKSTVGPRTSCFLKSLFSERQVKYKENKNKFCVMSNPEFLAEGVAIRDLEHPDRIIIGSDADVRSKLMLDKIVTLYSRFVPREKIITTSTFTAELSKLASNAFLAQRVSSINSLSPICEKLGIDVSNLSTCIGSDSRIGNKYLSASIGFGGSCLEKDLLALVYLARSLGFEEVADYWKAVYNINAYQKRRISDMIVQEMLNSLSFKKLTLLGVAFKKNTSDCRGSAALTVARDLLEESAHLQIYDPKATKDHFLREMQAYFPEEPLTEEMTKHIEFMSSPLLAAKDSSALIILTEWDEFRSLDYASLFEQMSKPAFVFDCRGVTDQEQLKTIGFKVYKLGVCLPQ